jgi:single-stranded-DNA-specific exonuclease
MKKIWQIAPSPPADFIAALSPLSPLLGLILWNRGFQNAQAVKDFLNNELDPSLSLNFADDKSLSFYDPFLFRDMDKAVDLIISHIKKGNKIMVYGDYDADGVTASSVLAEALNTMQVSTEVYLPDRVSEGYGLNKAALDEIKEQGFSLVITVDNGVRNKAEASYAKELGLDLIITDHHVLPEKEDLPDCLIIDPADKSDNYPWPYLAGVGVAFKLVCALLYRSKLEIKQKKLIAERSLDLVAVGTIADLVNLLGENRLLVKKGLEILNEKRRPGLNALFKIANINLDKPLEAWNVGWQLGPRLNAASRVGHANSAFALVNAKTEAEANELALELNRRNLSRQQITEEIIKQVESQIDQDNLPSLIIGVAPENQFWNEGVVGLVSGKICEKYHRPTLVIARIIEEADADVEQGKMVAGKLSFKGSGRSIEGFNLIEAITECSEHLDKYGGHPMACGFSVESEEKLASFREKLTQLANTRLTAEDLIPRLKLDVQVDFKDLSLSLAEEVNSLAPYGQNNPQPRLLSVNLRIEDIVFMGAEKQHIKLRLGDALETVAPAVWAIDFKVAHKYAELEIGDVIDLAYYLDINDFNGRREVQLKIIDWRLSAST